MAEDDVARAHGPDAGIDLPELVDGLDAVVWEASPETLAFRYVSRRGVEMLGYPREEWLEPDFWASRLIHPEDRATTIAACRGAVRDRVDHRLEYRALRADGGVLWVRDLIRVLLDDDGRAVRALRGVMIDITAEKTIEAHYRRLVATSPDAVFVVDAEGRIIEVNDAVQMLTGRTPAELLGTPFDRFIAPEALGQVGSLVRGLLDGTLDHVDTEVPVRHKAGSIRRVQVAVTPIVVEGKRVGVHGVARDVTEERATLARQRLLAAALDDLPDAVSITDHNLRVLYTNRAHAELLGYDRDNAPKHVSGFMDEAARDQVNEIYRALEQDRRWSGRMRRRRADGSAILLAANVFAVSDGHEDYAISVMRDASGEIARDQHLRRVERLASLGTLIGGVAHELNNPLTAVVGFAHLMLLDERSDEDRETLATMAREAERAARIVADLRVVARNTQEEAGAERVPVDLNDVVRHVLRVRRYSLETRNIEVREELAANLPRVIGNRAQLEQVVVNIVVNAEQALDRSEAPQRVLTVRTRGERNRVTLSFADTGPGIRADHLERIFDPFFTTKPPGEGTGLGLSLVHTIVEEHGGRMRVDSSPERGTDFVVDLPVAPETTSAVEPQPPSELVNQAARSLHVLVVDDEAAIRELLANVLRRRGHSVLEAREGGEALRLLEDRALEIDVVVSDVRMPGLDGPQLLEVLRERRPAVARRLIFITGDSAPAPFSMAELGTEVPVLLKPFQLDDAVSLIEQHGD